MMVFMMVLNRAPIARHSLQLPEGKRGKLSFNEVTSTRAVGWNMDRLETAARTRAEKTHSARGTDTGGFTQVFPHASLASNPESRPAKRSGDDQLRDGINRGHKEGAPSL
jgi:hypothetical protein